MTDDLRLLQWEALRRIADVIEEVRGSLDNAAELMAEKFFDATDPEPVFILRAQDKLALTAITEYFMVCMTRGLNEQGRQVQLAMHEFRDWQTRHPDRMKMPDHKHQPAITDSRTPEEECICTETMTIDVRQGHAPQCPMWRPPELTPKFTGDHAAIPAHCTHCPNPDSPDPQYHRTGAAHIVRTGPNSFAMDSRAHPIGRPIRDNPQA